MLNRREVVAEAAAASRRMNNTCAKCRSSAEKKFKL
jgi:hypothetical protein